MLVEGLGQIVLGHELHFGFPVHGQAVDEQEDGSQEAMVEILNGAIAVTAIQLLTTHIARVGVLQEGDQAIRKILAMDQSGPESGAGLDGYC